MLHNNKGNSGVTPVGDMSKCRDESKRRRVISGVLRMREGGGCRGIELGVDSERGGGIDKIVVDFFGLTRMNFVLRNSGRVCCDSTSTHFVCEIICILCASQNHKYLSAIPPTWTIDRSTSGQLPLLSHSSSIFSLTVRRYLDYHNVSYLSLIHISINNFNSAVSRPCESIPEMAARNHLSREKSTPRPPNSSIHTILTCSLRYPSNNESHGQQSLS